MITAQNINTVSELRFKTNFVLKKAQAAPVFLFRRSAPQAVLLSLENYEQLISLLEDYRLSLKGEEYETENKKKIKWVSHSQVKDLFHV